MSSWLKTWTAADVAEADDPARAFAEYCQQNVGIPWPTQKDLIILRKKAKDFFEQNPTATWYTLCRVANWMRSRRKRPGRVWLVVDNYSWAWQAGALPELDPEYTEPDEEVERGLQRALQDETNAAWRRRLIGAAGNMARKQALVDWRAERKVLA